MTAEILHATFGTATPLDRLFADLKKANGTSVEGIIEIGTTLTAYKKTHAHGEWGAVFEDKRMWIGERSAVDYMAVAKSEQIRTNGAVLPAAIGILRVLAGLDAALFSAALADGRIHPGMTRKDATAIKPPKVKSGTKRQTVAGRKKDTSNTGVKAAEEEKTRPVTPENVMTLLAECNELDRMVFDMILEAGPAGITKKKIVAALPEEITSKARFDQKLFLILLERGLIRAVAPYVFVVTADPLGPEPDPAAVPKSVQAYRARLEREFEWKLKKAMLAQWTEARLKFEEVFGPRVKAAETMRNTYRGIMTEEQYKLFRMCLHPDTSVSTEKKAEAFREFNSLKIKLLPPEPELKHPLPNIGSLYPRPRRK